MTMPAMPPIDSVEGLRERWPEWSIESRRLADGYKLCAVYEGMWSPPANLWDRDLRVFGESAAIAARALAAYLAAAGYPPKEE